MLSPQERITALLKQDALPAAAVTPLALFACLILARTALRILSTVYTTFLRPGKNLRKYGEWAVVTGATDGIGRAMSFEFAKRGLSVLLISRTESKLVEVEAELQKKYPKVKVAHVAVDYSNFDDKAQEAVKAAMASKDVGVLVNNVGVSYPYPKFFHELTDDELQSLITLNVTSTVVMTRLAVPAMLKKRKGAIVNMASAAAVAPTALLSGYSGAKGFVLKLSESLNVEYAPKGVHVQCQVPLLVATKLSKIKRASWDKPSPRSFAVAAVNSIGYERTVSPYWSHKLQLWVMDTLPFFLVNKITYGMHLGLRARALKKANKSS